MVDGEWWMVDGGWWIAISRFSFRKRKAQALPTRSGSFREEAPPTRWYGSNLDCLTPSVDVFCSVDDFYQFEQWQIQLLSQDLQMRKRIHRRCRSIGATVNHDFS